MTAQSAPSSLGSAISSTTRRRRSPSSAPGGPWRGRTPPSRAASPTRRRSSGAPSSRSSTRATARTLRRACARSRRESPSPSTLPGTPPAMRCRPSRPGFKSPASTMTLCTWWESLRRPASWKTRAASRSSTACSTPRRSPSPPSTATASTPPPRERASKILGGQPGDLVGQNCLAVWKDTEAFPHLLRALAGEESTAQIMLRNDVFIETPGTSRCSTRPGSRTGR